MHTARFDSVEQLNDLLSAQDEPVTNLANASAFLNELLPDINWVGFYLLKDGVLLLGPFQGKTACTRIAIGSGVCGTAVSENKTLRVDNVHEFKGHIACDDASNSELVAVLHGESGEPAGVLDIDSPCFARFSDQDVATAERAAEIVSQMIAARLP